MIIAWGYQSNNLSLAGGFKHVDDFSEFPCVLGWAKTASRGRDLFCPLPPAIGHSENLRFIMKHSSKDPVSMFQMLFRGHVVNGHFRYLTWRCLPYIHTHNIIYIYYITLDYLRAMSAHMPPKYVALHGTVASF